MICLRIKKTSEAKTPLGDFKVTTLENPLLSQQVVTSKGIQIPYTNLRLNPYPNTQLDLFCSDNLSFSMHGSQYMINQSMHGSKYVTNYQLEKDVDCKVLQFINTMKITKLLDYRTQQRTNTAAFSRERWTRKICLHSQFAWTNHLHQVSSAMTALKIILIYV